MRVLLLGGSGFLGSAIARRALQAGHDVWSVSRGARLAPEGVRGIVADRHDHDALASNVGRLAGPWDLVVDCIGFDAADAEQDVTLFREVARHLVFVSSDAVFDPSVGRFPLSEHAGYQSSGYGGGKRAAEVVLEHSDVLDMQWTVLRPTHIYGPGSELGCLPWHLRDPRLLGRLLAGDPLRLVAGGSILQQPVYVDDVADLALSCAGARRAHGAHVLAVGKEMVEAREYYRLIADALGVDLQLEEADMGGYLTANPTMRSVLTHRAYGDQSAALRALGLEPPSTALSDGIRVHVDYLMASRPLV